ncbi:MAG TPA: CoB--CoM heterodisulfide reductase iron-sulfur subunit A family protein [Anaerolineales bacterium]|nr:CoB--CoM heterodisulfide reductase iron-sulfur subunit A family protein [Anaerolineales bacterium]
MSAMHFDALVVGGGIAGLQTAVDLADQGFQVALVEREPSVGGKMITLSKVFPTLDCASCITTPKMAATAHHANIQLFTYCEVQSIRKKGAGSVATVLQKPRFVDGAKCTGCRLCEYACPITVPNAFDQNLGAYRAIRVPFPTAVPQTAVLDPANCLFCGKCETVCPVDAIDFTQKPETFTIHATAVILATGFKLTPIDAKKEYNATKLRNVIDPLMMERLLAPTGPYGRILRPGDGKEPTSIAYVQCAGSRDATLGVEYCSRVCCMYAIKQAMLLNGALPMADVTLYYMDIRTFGKGYEQFYQNAKAMGVNFVRGKVASIREDENQNPVVRVELTEEGRVEERTHDLVVLSLGMLPAEDLSLDLGMQRGQDGFIHIPKPNAAPNSTEQPGVFSTGTAMGPMDIVDSIVTASAAASAASAYIREFGPAPAMVEPSAKQKEAAYA